MITLSRRAKESIKTALAMTIAYGIALSMDWDNAKWTGFTVAMISLSTVGQSLNKAALRGVGTLIAFVVSLTLIAWFAQDRWLFITALIAWLGFCTYMMAGPRHQYLWHVAAFATVIIAVSGGADSANAFETAVLRAQENGLGILVYGLVAVLLWPNDSRADFETAVLQLAATQHRLYRTYYDLMNCRGEDADVQALRSTALQQEARFNAMLASAKTDSYEVWEVRYQWRHYQGLVSELAEVLEQWRESFNELQALELPRYFTNLAAFHAEMDRRFDQIECMLAGQVPESQPAVIELDVDMRALESLSHFQKAALGFTRSRAQRLASLTLSLFNCVSDIKGLQTNPSPPQTAPLSTSKTSTPAQGHDAGFTWDPDRMLSSVHVMLFVLMAWLLIIYVEGIPGGATLLALGVPIGMALATMPHIPITRMFLPATGSVLFGGLVYIFVLPKLSSFIGLGALLFTVTFAICYLFAAPQQALGRALGLAMFIAITAIDNQQSYSFLHVADTAMVFPLFFALLMMAAYIPYPPLPERVFLRLLTRYFRSAGYLVSTLGKDPQQPLTRREAWRKRYHAQQIATLPGKLGIWGKIIDPRLFPATDPKQVQALVVNMHALSFRISALIEARQHAQAELLARELTQDVRRWREAIQVLFRNWSQQPEKTPAQPLEQRLQTLLATLEARISESFEKIGKEKLMREDYQNFYRLLGAFRGLSEALVSYADLSGRMSLAQWRESRF